MLMFADWLLVLSASFHPPRVPPPPAVSHQGKRRDSGPYVEYGSWYKACKVDRWVAHMKQIYRF